MRKIENISFYLTAKQFQDIRLKKKKKNLIKEKAVEKVFIRCHNFLSSDEPTAT